MGTKEDLVRQRQAEIEAKESRQRGEQMWREWNERRELNAEHDRLLTALVQEEVRLAALVEDADWKRRAELWKWHYAYIPIWTGGEEAMLCLIRGLFYISASGYLAVGRGDSYHSRLSLAYRVPRKATLRELRQIVDDMRGALRALEKIQSLEDLPSPVR